jgi:predicted nuclease of predicted toxin-antitoxin system
MHRLFIDQNVRLEVAACLRADGHEVVHASEAGLAKRDDETILRWATERGLAVVTFDIDFAERAYWTADPHHGVIRLRLEPQTPAHILPVLHNFLRAYSPESLNNALVILTEDKVRLRRK